MYKKSLRQVNIVIFLFLFLISIVSLVLANPIILFVISTILLIFLIKRAKFSYFSVLSFILWYSYLQGVLQKTVGVTGNTLAWAGVKMPFYFNELSIATITYFLIAIFFVYFTDIIKSEKKLYSLKLNLSFSLAAFLGIIAIILILLVFPSVPTFKVASEELRRTQGLSSLYGLVLLALLLCGLTVDQSFKHKSLVLIYLFIIFWSFGHGERVEVLGFLIFYVLKYINQDSFIAVKKNIVKNKKRIINISILIFIILIAGMWLGLTRESTQSSVSLNKLFFNFIEQGTCGDVVYVFNCATDLWKNGNALHGLTYLDYLFRLVPGASSTFSAPVMIMNFYQTQGGGLFFAEPMMNFGIIGVIVMNIFFFLIMKIIISKVSKYREYFWIPIVIEIFRTAWYGRGSWMLASFIEVPILYFVINVLLKGDTNKD